MERAECDRLSKKELAISTAIWTTVSLGSILAAIINLRADSDDNYPHDDNSYQPKAERLTNPHRHSQSIFRRDLDAPFLESTSEKIILLPVEPTSQPTLETAPEPTSEEDNIYSPGSVLEIMKSHSQEFNPQDLADVTMYFSIYQTVAQKYDLDWYLLWIIHRLESTCSRDERAFESGRIHYGAMQRAVDYYSKEDVRAAAQGLENLATFPQKHHDDWEEIAWAASKLRADAQYAKSPGIDNSLLAALHAYSAAGPANYRYELYQKYQTIFEPQSQ